MPQEGPKESARGAYPLPTRDIYMCTTYPLLKYDSPSFQKRGIQYERRNKKRPQSPSMASRRQ